MPALNSKSKYNTTLKYTPPKSLPPTHKGDFTPKMIISQHAIDIIETLCKKISNTEWSGYIFYKLIKDATSLKDISNIEIEVLDVLPLNIGSGTYTEFRMDNDKITEFLETHPEYCAEGYFMGLIHSHHSMSTRPSSTDLNELAEMASEYYQMFVSLIVNNNGEYFAALAHKMKTKIVGTSENIVNTFKGEVKGDSSNVCIDDLCKVLWYEFDITKASRLDPQIEDIVDKFIEDNKKPVCTNSYTKQKKYNNTYKNNDSTIFNSLRGESKDIELIEEELGFPNNF